MNNILNQLQHILEERKQRSPDSSYVSSLHDKGLNKILEKVGEEAIETILAARNVDAGSPKKEVISETADLWFHSMVMLSHLNIDYTEVLQELEQRFSISGLEEKKSRPKYSSNKKERVSY